jgi:hypothetical protein
MFRTNAQPDNARKAVGKHIRRGHNFHSQMMNSDDHLLRIIRVRYPKRQQRQIGAWLV